MTSIRHISDREMALQRENARLVDKTERQAATIHVQAVAIQAMKADAERYQWLRRLDHFASVDERLNSTHIHTLDMAVDEAMKESKS